MRPIGEDHGLQKQRHEASFCKRKVRLAAVDCGCWYLDLVFRERAVFWLLRRKINYEY